MTVCIVIDGWHSGESMILSSPAPPSIRMLRPKVVTTCYCNEDEWPETFEAKDTICEYKIVFRAIDGEVALYSVSGNSRDVIGGRLWVAHPKYTEADTLYFNCHDERAWPQEVKTP